MQEWIQALDDLRPQVRREALEHLCRKTLPPQEPQDPVARGVNLHCHTIYSYNGYGHSPAFLAWWARTQGWYALGTVEFDVLDGVEETLWACEVAQVRGAAGLETRVYLTDHANVEYNSPGEPGVMYVVGMGFVRPEVPEVARPVLEDLRRRAEGRNRKMVALLNDYLAPVYVDYDQDVLPLTPSGNATERHLLIAYDAAARRRFPTRSALVAFWADKLGMAPEAVEAFLGDAPFPHDPIRARLMKQGGVAYMPAGPDAFPPFRAVIDAITACEALPCYAFLDGQSEGERDVATLLEEMLARGIVGVVAIPDRNWNVADAAKQQDLVQRFHRMLDLARAMRLPVFIGTEMNRAGQKMIDDLRVPALAPYARDFICAAELLYGHTVLQSLYGAGYLSPWARSWLPDRGKRNAFYAALGRALAPEKRSEWPLSNEMVAAGPEAVLECIGA